MTTVNQHRTSYGGYIIDYGKSESQAGPYYWCDVRHPVDKWHLLHRHIGLKLNPCKLECKAWIDRNPLIR